MHGQSKKNFTPERVKLSNGLIDFHSLYEFGRISNNHPVLLQVPQYTNDQLDTIQRTNKHAMQTYLGIIEKINFLNQVVISVAGREPEDRPIFGDADRIARASVLESKRNRLIRFYDMIIAVTYKLAEIYYYDLVDKADGGVRIVYTGLPLEKCFERAFNFTNHFIKLFEDETEKEFVDPSDMEKLVPGLEKKPLRKKKH